MSSEFDPHDTTAVRQIGRFRIVELLGEGGFGMVYRAHDPNLQRDVALKVPRSGAFADAEEVERFRREARAAATLRHPNICPVYEFGEHEKRHFIAMAFIEGATLADKIHQSGPLSEAEAALMVRKLALAIDAAHSKNIIHRDLKPANIMIESETGEPVVMDFGLARNLSGDQPTLTQQGQAIGTPAYMSPEQARGQIKAIGVPTDVYSLGAILYQLLSGKLPFKGTTAEIIGQILCAEPEAPSQFVAVDPRLEAICQRAMAKRIEDRYPSMKEFANDLGVFLGIKIARDDVTTIIGRQTGDGQRMSGDTIAEAHPRQPDSPPTLRESALRSRRKRSWFRTVAIGGLALGLIGAAIAIGLLSNSHDKINPGPSDDNIIPDTTSDDTIIANSIGMKLKYIPAGQFTMGSPEEEEDRNAIHEKQRKVTIKSDYYIGLYEVTQEEYEQVTGENPSHHAPGGGANMSSTERFPVDTIVYDAARAFCRMLSDLPAEKEAGRSYRLPTEAEWEFACRAGTKTATHYGDFISPREANTRYSYGPTASAKPLGRTEKVGSYKPNKWGLFDMHGNVSEWCSDEFTPLGSNRVTRGGGWNVGGSRCRSAHRMSRSPWVPSHNIGLRVVCEIGSKD